MSSQDLGRAELVALPLLLLLLFFVFRGLRAAALPLLGAMFAIAVTLGVIGLVMVVVPLSIFALNLVIALGLGLSVDFSLLIVSRFREEYRQQGSIDAALVTVRHTAGRTVLFSSITIAAAMATLGVFPERFVYSMGIAGAIVVLAAGAFALFVLPSILTVFGERIATRPSSGRRHDLPANGGAQVAGRWYRLAKLIMRRPALWALSALLILVVLAAPFLHVSFTGADASSLPASSSAGSAYELVQSKFADFSEAPASMVVDAARATPGALGSVAPPRRPRSPVSSPSRLLSTSEALVGVQRGPRLRTAVVRSTAKRERPPIASWSRTVDGRRADRLLLDAAAEPQGAPAAGSWTDHPDRALVMLFAMTRSVVLPVMAVVMNILTIGATFGMLVFVFQWGHFRHLLGFSGPGALQSTSLIIILAVVFGLSTDYGVFLLGRMKEEHDAGASPDEAVALGLDRTGGIITAAALCLALAMGALVLSRLVFVKELGLGVAFAVLLDATVVRAVLVPAVMKLLGSFAWWSPWSPRPVQEPISVTISPNVPLAPGVGSQRRPYGSQIRDGQSIRNPSYEPASPPTPATATHAIPEIGETK